MKKLDPDKKKISKGIALPPKLWDRIEKEAEEQDRSIAYIIRRVLENHFK